MYNPRYTPYTTLQEVGVVNTCTQNPVTRIDIAAVVFTVIFALFYQTDFFTTLN